MTHCFAVLEQLNVVLIYAHLLEQLILKKNQKKNFMYSLCKNQGVLLIFVCLKYGNNVRIF
jgi:hypothetical protein